MAISAQLVCILLTATFIILVTKEQTIWKLIMTFLLVIPSTAQGLISGASYSTPGIINLSMVGYMTIIAGVILLLRHKKLEKKITCYLFGCNVIILFIRIIADGMDFISNKLCDNYFLPMLLAILIVSYLKTKYIPELIKFMYIFIIIGAIIACIEYVYGKSLLFHQYYMNTCPWYETIYLSSFYVPFRSCSIFGHPLIGGIYYLIGVAYLLNIGTKEFKSIAFILQLVILVLAILSTNSRSALLGLTLYIVYYLLKTKKIGKLFALLCIIIALLFIIDWKLVYYSLFARDSSGSSFMVRVRALLSIVNIPIESFIFGEGYNNTSSLLSTFGFSGNVEISYLIILMENGIMGFWAWLASILYFFQKKHSKNIENSVYLTSLKGMLFCVFFVGGMSNSFGDPGTLNYTIYILLSFYYLLGKNPIEENVRIRRKYKIYFSLGRKMHLKSRESYKKIEV